MPNWYQFTSIDTVEDAIISAKNSKVQKENPSSIVGTGPNGEITGARHKKSQESCINRKNGFVNR